MSKENTQPRASGLLGVGLDGDPKLLRDRCERGVCGLRVFLRHRERQLRERAFGARLVLDDHVDVDAGVGERGRHTTGDAGAIGHAHERYAGLRARVGDGGDQRVFHRIFLCLFA